MINLFYQMKVKIIVMRRQKGFTLIELLVVITIIAMLVAILVPVLGRARRLVKGVLCKSYLREWGVAFLMYAEDNEGYLPAASSEWPNVLQLYYNDVKSLFCCPMATKPVSEGGRHPFAAFSISGAWGPPSGTRIEGVRSSYGINGWVCNPPQSVTTNPLGLPTANNFRKVNVKGASNIPLLLDSMWVDSYPDTTNEPPAFDGDEFGSGPMGSKQMRFFCINRHNGFVNSVFLDSSVRKIGLKELWKLKWHSNSDTNAPTPDWPDWMKGFKDY